MPCLDWDLEYDLILCTAYSFQNFNTSIVQYP